MSRPRFPRPLLLLCVPAMLLVGCRTPELFLAPKPDDPLDGHKGVLAEAGVNTGMDWGPDQENLLGEYKVLKDEHAKLRREYEELVAQKRTLQTRLDGEGDALTRERALRAQAEAEAASLREKRRELEARILGLGIEKAKLEQASLLAKIADLDRALEEFAPVGAEAAPPGGDR